MTGPSDLLHREEAFHDEWASSVDPASVPVRESFTLSFDALIDGIGYARSVFGA